jgi:hypothetical protein
MRCTHMQTALICIDVDVESDAEDVHERLEASHNKRRIKGRGC